MAHLVPFLFRQWRWQPKPIQATSDLKCQTALITGANGGLGLEAAKEIATLGIGRLILGVRDKAKGEDVKREIQVLNPNIQVLVWKIDHDDYDSLLECAKEAATIDRLDIVILNAGVMNLDYGISKTGHERNLQVNHISTALLSLLLLPTLKATSKRYSKPSRLTVVSSIVHEWTPFNEHKYPQLIARMDEADSMKSMDLERYSSTKLLQVLWVRQLASAVNSTEVTVNCVNPGLCQTPLHQEHVDFGYLTATKWFGWTPVQGGHCILDAAIAQNNESHGQYISFQAITP